MEEGITKVRREEALLKRRALQRAIFNRANFSCIVTDAKGEIRMFNVGAERIPRPGRCPNMRCGRGRAGRRRPRVPPAGRRQYGRGGQNTKPEAREI
jgi:hypothetical protein